MLSGLGHGDSAATLPALLDRVAPWDVQVVDLSGDFRLRDAATYERYYGRPHPAPERLGRAVYGLPELTRALLPGARFVASAGCFATAAILSIAPAAAAAWGLDSIAIAGMTGSSGAGAAPGAATHHPRRASNVEAYRPLDHQHLPEIAAAFAFAGGEPGVRLGFVPHRAPMVRGVYITAVLTGSTSVDEERAVERYRDFYRDAPFVRLLDRPPAVVEVWGSNRCDLQRHRSRRAGGGVGGHRQPGEGRRRPGDPEREPRERVARDRGPALPSALAGVKGNNVTATCLLTKHHSESRHCEEQSDEAVPYGERALLGVGGCFAPSGGSQ